MTKEAAKDGMQKSIPAIERTSAGLRGAIFDEIDAIRNGTSNPTRANAVAKLAMSVVETVRMEVEVQKHIRGMAGTVMPDFGLGKPLALSSH